MGFFGKSKEEKLRDFIRYLKENGVNINVNEKAYALPEIKLLFPKEYDSFKLVLGKHDFPITIVYANGVEVKTEMFTNPEKFAEKYVEYEFPRGMIRYEVDIEKLGDNKRKELILKILLEIKKNFEIICTKPEYKKYLEIKEKVEEGASWGVRPETSSGMRIYRLYARECIYNFHRDEYELPFEQYEIHHINGDTLDNDLRNLQIIKKEEHEKIHGRTW